MTWDSSDEACGPATSSFTKRSSSGSDSGAATSIQELSSIVTQILERAPQPVRGRFRLFVRYLRRKPGRWLTVVYSADALSVHRRSPAHLVTVTLDEDALAGTQVRFNASQVQQAELELQAPGIVKVAGLGLMVQVFPADSGLLGLAESCTVARDSILFRVLETAARVQLAEGNWHLCSAEVEPIRYKPSSRCVLRYSLELQRSFGETSVYRELSLYGKVYSDPEKAATLHSLLQQLYAEQARAGEPIMPRPLRMVGRLGLTLNEAIQSVEGAEPLRTGLQALQPRFIRGCAGEVLDVVIPEKELCITAEALARLHTSTIRLPGPLRTGAEEAKRATARAALIASYYSAQAEAVQRLAQQVATRLEVLQPDAYRVAHGGFKPSQLLFCGERAFVVDMDGLCLADAALDVGYFLAYLRPSGLWYHRSGMCAWSQRAMASFRKAYRQALFKHGIGEATTCKILQRACLYEAATLLKIATRRVHRLNSPRPAELSAMLAEITECLSNGHQPDVL
jgi:hypothetical protein